jgi:hypothetical protein
MNIENLTSKLEAFIDENNYEELEIIKFRIELMDSIGNINLIEILKEEGCKLNAIFEHINTYATDNNYDKIDYVDFKLKFVDSKDNVYKIKHENLGENGE